MLDLRAIERRGALRKRARLLASRSADSLARDISVAEAAEVAEALFAATVFAVAYMLQHPGQAVLLGRLWKSVMKKRSE